MIRVAICDDEKECQLHIQKQVLTIFEKLNETIETYLYGDGKEVIRTLIKDENVMDILLLDINMPGLSGIQVAKAIRERNISILIIFVSAQEQYVFESIKYQPFRFVRKSTINRELEPALIAAIGNIHMQNCMRIHIKTENGKMWIAPEDILYCETLGRKVKIYMKNGYKYTVNKHLKEIKEQIDIDKHFYKFIVAVL